MFTHHETPMDEQVLFQSRLRVERQITVDTLERQSLMHRLDVMLQTDGAFKTLVANMTLDELARMGANVPSQIPRPGVLLPAKFALQLESRRRTQVGRN
jgi:hypothetical protein